MYRTVLKSLGIGKFWIIVVSHFNGSCSVSNLTSESEVKGLEQVLEILVSLKPDVRKTELGNSFFLYDHD